MKFICTILVSLCIISNTACVKNFKVYRNLNTAKGMLDKGVDLYVRGEYKDAIKVFREILVKFPNKEKEKAWAQYEIGFCFFHLSKLDKAVIAFRKVLDEYSVRGPRILAARMIIKIKKGISHIRSAYEN